MTKKPKKLTQRQQCAAVVKEMTRKFKTTSRDYSHGLCWALAFDPTPWPNRQISSGTYNRVRRALCRHEPHKYLSAYWWPLNKAGYKQRLKVLRALAAEFKPVVK